MNGFRHMRKVENRSANFPGHMNVTNKGHTLVKDELGHYFIKLTICERCGLFRCLELLVTAYFYTDCSRLK